MTAWPVLLTVEEAAEALRTDAAHIALLHADGRLPGVQLFPDEPLRFRPEDLLALVDDAAACLTGGDAR